MAFAALALAAPQARAQATAQLPNAPGKDTFGRVCGACHSAGIVLGRGMTREEWGGVVSGMISRGAKGTQAEFATVIDYLAANFPPKQAVGNPASPRRGGGGGFSMGPDEKQIVDAAAAERGKALYVTDCASCHGPLARGGQGGPDLVRSVTVLHDRYGSTLGPLLRTNHPMPAGQHLPSFAENQIQDLSHFLHQQVNDVLRSGPYTKVLNVLTGDAKAGEAYFNGAGTCNHCHSPTGDLAGIASKIRSTNFAAAFPVPAFYRLRSSRRDTG